MTHQKTCEECGHAFLHAQTQARFCCHRCHTTARSRRAKNKYRLAKGLPITPEPKPEPERPHAPFYRASSLAMTPEKPVTVAGRDAMLTGAAAARCHGAGVIVGGCP